MKLYIGTYHFDLMQPSPIPPGTYASEVVGKGIIRRARFYGEALDEVIRKALNNCQGEKTITMVMSEPRSKYPNAMLKKEGYNDLSSHEFFSAIVKAKQIREKEFGDKIPLIEVA